MRHPPHNFALALVGSLLLWGCVLGVVALLTGCPPPPQPDAGEPDFCAGKGPLMTAEERRALCGPRTIDDGAHQ